MSNNAVSAYNNGEKPLSKWTKTDIFKEIQKMIKEEEIILSCNMEKLQKLPANFAKKYLLHCSSWHHTSCKYNKTDFYSLDVDYIENLTDEFIENLIIKAKEEAKKEKEIKPTEEKWKCAYLEWSGTRKHPTATEYIEIGIIRGNWFYLPNGQKKKTTANGFRMIERVE